MMTDGLFMMSDDWLTKVRDAAFVVLETGVNACKCRALRLIVKLCQRCFCQMRPFTKKIKKYGLNCVDCSEDPATKLCVTECLKTLATTLVMPKVVEMVENELIGNCDDKKEIVLEMVREMFEKFEDFELRDAVDSLAPLLVEVYNTSFLAKLRKKAIASLLLMCNRMGSTTMEQYITKLPMQKQNELGELKMIARCSD